jgi:hypothetical protein
MFINDTDDNEEIKFTNHTNLLKSLASDDTGEILMTKITNAWDQFSHYSINKCLSHLQTQIENYASALIEHISGLPSSIDTTRIKSEPRKKSQ